MNTYLNELNNLPVSKVIKEMRKYAEANKVPIINDEGLIFMLQLVDLKKPKRFLEIGTAIGFCAINLATYDSDIIVDTIEKNEIMFAQALKNVQNARLEKRINVYLGDALDFDLSKLQKDYDMIFIDAAKAQYIKFFEKYEQLLAEDGLIVSDNLLFHGFVENTKIIEHRNLRQLVDKIQDYNEFLAKHRSYHTNFFAVGDGIAVSKRVKK
ncbi:MAG: O-methyltransferase [Acholeplasmataceae bacterium]|jgi:predicted O-methyltransferase YrrM|nr:O-methyltransferase [Acholeplasmataceae bacterium]